MNRPGIAGGSRPRRRPAARATAPDASLRSMMWWGLDDLKVRVSGVRFPLWPLVVTTFSNKLLLISRLPFAGAFSVSKYWGSA
jgi:hypothetical protein